jgi:hypothetical protein
LGISATRNVPNYTPSPVSVNDFFVTNPTKVSTSLYTVWFDFSQLLSFSEAIRSFLTIASRFSPSIASNNPTSQSLFAGKVLLCRSPVQRQLRAGPDLKR